MKKKIRRLSQWIEPNRFRVMIGLISMALTAIVVGLFANHACDRAAKGRLYLSLADVPQRDVGLVLGTSKDTRHGNTNLHFSQRIGAAAALYRAGKVRHLLVSGDNHIAGYDEPTDMRNALIAKRVPAPAITCDYAGFHTLDSIVRAKEVFGLSQCTIVSEEFHCPRALWIARQHGLDAIAFAAPDVGLKSWSWRAKVREQLARTWCAVDMYVLHRGPKFLGPKEPILLSVAVP